MAEAVKKAAAPGNVKHVFTQLKKDPMAFGALILLVLLYLSVALADFLAPYPETWSDRALAHAPPTPIYLMDENGSLRTPFVFGYKRDINPTTYQWDFVPDYDTKYEIRLFVTGAPYKLFGFIPGNLRLFGAFDPVTGKPGRIALLGNDINGRDVFSRMLYGGQISMTIGFLALFVAFPIGLIYGGISGYFGGVIDNMMMRLAEIIMSIPTFFLLVSLAAILPPRLSSTTRFGMVVVILAFIGWAGLSRVIRGMVLSIKEKEFVEAERAVGLPSLGIIIKHILPQTASYVLVAMTMSVPGYILAESGLSFLGLGIQQPDASWGNMLKEAQDVNNILTRPMMLMPGFLIFIAVLAFNVLGDAVRDILDPKSRARR